MSESGTIPPWLVGSKEMKVTSLGAMGEWVFSPPRNSIVHSWMLLPVRALLFEKQTETRQKALPWMNWHFLVYSKRNCKEKVGLTCG